MTLQGRRDLRVPGPELGCQYFVVWALSQAGGEVGVGTIVWESWAPGQDPSPAEAPRFPPVTITGLCAVCTCRPQAGRGAATLSRGMGTPGNLGAGGLLGDGAAGGWHQGFINCPLCHLGDRALFLGFKEAAPVPGLPRGPPAPRKPAQCFPCHREMRFAFINISRSCGENRFELGRKLFIFA